MMATQVLHKNTAGLLLAMLLGSITETSASQNINAENCGSKYLFDDSFVIPPGAARSTVMQYATETAISRAVFYTLIYNWTAIDPVSRFRNPEQAMYEYDRQPGLNYIYMSTAATVHAAPAGVKASGLFFDTHRVYPNWLYDVAFNSTLNLFGIKANDSLIKEFGSTSQTNYTDRYVFRQNGFYQLLSEINWRRSPMKYYEMRLFNEMGLEADKFVALKTKFGEHVTVLPPYFDCGQSNMWLIDAVSMVTELMPRNTLYTYLQHLKSVAASTVSVDLDALQGLDSVTGLSTDRPSVSPDRRARGQIKLDEQDTAQCENLASPAAPVPLPNEFWNEQDLALTLEAQGREGLRLSHFLSNFLQNNDFADNERNLQVIQAAWRNWRYDEDPPTFESPMIEVLSDRDLTYKQMASEVFATLVSGGKIKSVGIFLDTGVFPGSTEPVSAFAWKDTNRGDSLGNVMDLYQDGEDFTAEDWFVQAKQAYAQMSSSNTKLYSTFREVRVSRNSAARPTPQPMTYTATSYEQGTWLPPHFICSTQQAGWVASYVSPILVPGSAGQEPVFGGVVKVDAVFTADNISPN